MSIAQTARGARAASRRRTAAGGDLLTAAIQADNPVWWVRGNGTLVDETGGTTGTMVGGGYRSGPLLPNRPTAQGMAFDGVDDYASFAYQSKFNQAGAFTVSAFIIPDAVQSGYREVVSRQGQFYFGLYDGKPTFGLLSNGGDYEAYVSTHAVVTPGTLYHLAGRYTGSAVTISIDAVQVESTPTAGTPTANISPVYVGSWLTGTSEQFDGAIIDAAMFGTALSDARFSAHNTAARTAP